MCIRDRIQSDLSCYFSFHQVSAAAHQGLDGFRATLAPLRWLALRGTLLERLCAVTEGLPALAKSADEK